MILSLSFMKNGSVSRIVKKSPAFLREGSFEIAALRLSTIWPMSSLKKPAFALADLSDGVMNVFAKKGKKKRCGCDILATR